MENWKVALVSGAAGVGTAQARAVAPDDCAAEPSEAATASTRRHAAAVSLISEMKRTAPPLSATRATAGARH